MDFPELTFPLAVDFGDTEYWIREQGPFKYGTAVTAFFVGEDIGPVSNDGIPLMHELEHQLRTFGSHLQPYVRERAIDADSFSIRRSSPSATPCVLPFMLQAQAQES